MTWTHLDCAWCGRPRKSLQSFCEHCASGMTSRPLASEMTVDERIAELRSFHEGGGRYLMVPFGMLHSRVEALMDRPVWTHEFADMDALIGELEGARTWPGPLGSLVNSLGAVEDEQ